MYVISKYFYLDAILFIELRLKSFQAYVVFKACSQRAFELAIATSLKLVPLISVILFTLSDAKH